MPLRRIGGQERARNQRILSATRQHSPGTMHRPHPGPRQLPAEPAKHGKRAWYGLGSWLSEAGNPPTETRPDRAMEALSFSTHPAKKGAPETPSASPAPAARPARRTGPPPQGSPLAAPFLRMLLFTLAAAFILAGASAPALAQVYWLNFEDGEILNVSSAEGPPMGLPFIQFRRSLENSTVRGELLMNRLRFQYGVTPYLSFGASTVHLEQLYHGFHKKGMGDTNLSLKLHFRPSADWPVRVGLRQSLSLPTGYEREKDGLAAFTSRQNDYSAQLLFHYLDHRFSAYLNPGVLLPGGSANSFLTGGLGFAFTLPWRLDLRGEYYTRWDMVDRRFESELYGGARTPLLVGLSLQGGVKRRLLQNEEVDPEYQVALSFGRDRTPETDVYEVRAPKRVPASLVVHPIESAVADPYGVKGRLGDLFRTDRSGQEGLAVYVRSLPGDASVEVRERHYELNIKILELSEGSVKGLDLPPLARVARSETEIVAMAELIAPDGYSVLRRAVFRGSGSKTLGVDLAPDSGSLESIVTPDEVREALREKAMRDLTRQILSDVVWTIQGREEL